MPIAAIAPAVVSILTPLVAKGAKALAETAGEAAAGKAQQILGALKSRWSGDPVASDTLRRFESSPERYEPMLQDVLEEKIREDAGLSQELAELLEQLGPGLTVIQDLGKVSGEVTGVEAGELGGKARVSVEQSADEVSGKITGAKIDRIG